MSATYRAASPAQQREDRRAAMRLLGMAIPAWAAFVVMMLGVAWVVTGRAPDAGALVWFAPAAAMAISYAVLAREDRRARRP